MARSVIRETGVPIAQVPRELGLNEGRWGSVGEPGPARLATVRDRSKITKGPGSKRRESPWRTR
jgi:hypothetical protein